MPRPPKVENTFTTPPNSMVASAMKMTGVRTVWQPKEGWQSEAWRLYDAIGELRFSANWVGRVLSRARLVIVKKSSLGTWEEVKAGPAVDALDALFGGNDGQAQMLKQFGVHFFVPGECYLVGRAPREDRNEYGNEDIWEVVSTEEMQNGGPTGWQINFDDGLPPVFLDKETETVIRMWMPHPRKRMLADSPVKAQLNNLRELELLSRRVSAQARSQLAGNGLTFIPSEMSFPPDPDNPNQTAADALMNQLGAVMLEAIADPTSPAAVVPTFASAPGEYIDKVNHINFWSPFDEQLPGLRKESIGRFAVGIDTPPEVLLGTADMNHWGSWQVEESSIKVTVEPLLEILVNCLNVGYLWPITQDKDQRIGYDTSQLRLRPNRSKEAIELWDRGELSSEALRRETGFDESDAPDEQEYIHWLLSKVASGSATPEMVSQALAILGVEGVESDEQAMREARPSPSLEEHPVRELPERAAASASIYDKSEVIVYRALERAGNRLRSLKQVRPDCPAYAAYMFIDCGPGDLDKVLEDAWSIIPTVMPNIPDFERAVIAHALDTYCRNLILTKKPHERNEMERYMTSTSISRL